MLFGMQRIREQASHIRCVSNEPDRMQNLHCRSNVEQSTPAAASGFGACARGGSQMASEKHGQCLLTAFLEIANDVATHMAGVY